MAGSGGAADIAPENLDVNGWVKSRPAGYHAQRQLSIPVTWNLAGGYQIENDGSIPRVVELHLNTFEEALRVWQML